jgi:hypothetical protein
MTDTKLPDGVNAVLEIVIDGLTEEAIKRQQERGYGSMHARCNKNLSRKLWRESRAISFSFEGDNKIGAQGSRHLAQGF